MAEQEKDHIQTVNESVSQAQQPKLITEVQEYGTGNSVANVTVSNGPELISEEDENEETE